MARVLSQLVDLFTGCVIVVTGLLVAAQLAQAGL